MRQSTALDSAAQRLRDLHQIARPLLLVNVWDAAGAQAVEAAGSPVIATSSVAMAGVRGGSDGNRDREAAFAQLRQITAAVDVPVTADLEGGYDLAAGDLVDALFDAGAVGCNIEDTDHATGDRLLDSEARAAYLADIRAAADQRGVRIVLNARIDAIIPHPRHPPPPPPPPPRPARRRGRGPPPAPPLPRRRRRLRLPDKPARPGAGGT